jgi:hypothetical protein
MQTNGRHYIDMNIWSPHHKAIEYVYSSLQLFIISGFLIFTIVGCGNFNVEIKSTESQSNQSSSVENPCLINSLIAGPCIVETAGVTVTDTYGNDVTSWTNTAAGLTVTANIPDAYYANKQVSFSEPNLLASNIKSGVTIFGVTGNAAGIVGNCFTNGLQSTDCRATASSYWTTILGANITGTNGSISATIQAGYYDGTQTVTVQDSNLVASKIKSGITIFGVMGTSAEESHSGCNSNGQTGCVTSALWLAGSPQSNLNLTNGTLSATIPQGYYDGTKTVIAADTNLVNTNLRSGVSVFGVTGNLTPAYAACTDDALNGGQCSTAANRYVYPTANGGRAANCGVGLNGSACWTNASSQYVTGTVGANITTWTNVTASTIVDGAIPLGYYPGNTIAFTDTDLIASNIKSGVSIFNVIGSYAVGVTLMSNVHRDSATTQLTQDEEKNNYIGSNLPAGYREIPDIDKDDEGYVGGNVTFVNRTAFVDCGTTQNTIAARIANCASLNGLNATWNGSVKGNAGQGSWKLVTRAGANNEVWQDQQTNLVWSSKYSIIDNWCRATGNAQASDPAGYCSSLQHQHQYPTAQSLCSENGTVAVPGWCTNPVYGNSVTCEGDFETWTVNNENFSTGVYSVKKGGMGKISSASSPSVSWRLPTISDYKYADVNGIRFVLPDMAATGGGAEWSATINSNTRTKAWTFSGTNGRVADELRSDEYVTSIRCVGR